MGMILSDQETRALQRFLLAEGEDLGPLRDDGDGGRLTHGAFKRRFDRFFPRPAIGAPAGPPAPDFDSMVAFYGEPGIESSLVSFSMPFPMFIAWDTDGDGVIKELDQKISKHRCHGKIKVPLEAALSDLLAHFGEEGIDRYGLNLFGGCYNNRSVRGGRTTSKHAWGAAIDINPAANGNQVPWRADKVGQPGWATMPVAAVEIFEAHGFKHGGRAWGRDAMHFQFTK